MLDPRVAVRGREASGALARPVGGAVVDQQELVGRALLCFDRREEDGQVIGLVEEGHDHHEAERAAHRPASAPGRTTGRVS